VEEVTAEMMSIEPPEAIETCTDVLPSAKTAVVSPNGATVHVNALLVPPVFDTLDRKHEVSSRSVGHWIAIRPVETDAVASGIPGRRAIEAMSPIPARAKTTSAMVAM